MQSTTDNAADKPIQFEDLPLAACFIYGGFQLDVEPAALPDGFVTFVSDRTPQSEQLLQDFVTVGLSVDPRRFYDALGIAKRLVHRARATVR